ncbi:MAG TPA: CHAP domain-containing protein [Patescibacteria group bacterium]|nr:CHAP domain-containing protein [Patescibacteria group bacterium]
MADLTPAQQLHALLNPTTTEGQQRINANDTLKRLSATYKHALETANTEDLHQQLGQIVRELNQANLFEPDPDRVWGTLETQTEQPQENTFAQTPAPTSPTLQDFFAKDTQNSRNIVDPDKIHVSEKLYQAQRDVVLQEFDQLLATTPADQLPNAVEQFYRTHLSAAGVLGRQYQILLNQAQQLAGFKRPDALETQSQEAVERLRSIHQRDELTEEEQKQKDHEDAGIQRLQQLVPPTGRLTDETRASLREQAASLFDEEWSRRQRSAIDGVLGNLGNFYTPFVSQVVDEGFTITPITTVVQEPSTRIEEPPTPVPPSQPTQKAPQSQNGLLGRLGRQVGKKGAENIAKQVAEREATAAVVSTAPEWVPVVGVVLLVLLILFLCIFIVVFIYKKIPLSNNQQSPDISLLVTVVNDIATCEHTAIGGWHPPTPLCLTGLRIGNIVNGTTGIDLQGFLDDVNRGYPNFQCGQFIWAVQKYVLNWPVFPGNVATVYQWYQQYKNTMPGYVFIDNPDNPALIGNNRAIHAAAGTGALGQGAANILPGDIIIYGSTGGNDPGHIAIVTVVQSDNFTITVAEANYHSGAIDLRPTNLNDGLGRGAYILGWWRRNQSVLGK